MSSDLHRKFFKALQTLHEMMLDRKWSIHMTIGAAGVSSLQEFEKYVQYGGEIYMTASRRNKTKTKTMLIYMVPTEAKIGVKTVREIAERCTSDDIQADHLMIVYIEDITPFAKKELLTLEMQVEQFKLNALQFNVTRHVLQPKFTALTSKEKDTLLELNNIALKNLPRFLASDPVVRYYNWKRGTVVKIDTHAVQGHAYNNHRVVVQG